MFFKPGPDPTTCPAVAGMAISWVHLWPRKTNIKLKSIKINPKGEIEPMLQIGCGYWLKQMNRIII